MSDPAPIPPPKRSARTRRLSCPGCGGSIEVRANGISVSAICGSCGRTVDVANEDLRIIAEAQQHTRTPDLPIGTRGTRAGTEWEVVGFQARSNPEEGWTWDEYLLFNPYRGFRFLAHDDEGWTLYCMLRQDVPNPARVDGRSYSGPEASQARTDYVLGEFYWRVRVGDLAQVEQYEAKPYLLVKETTGDEIVWSRGLNVPETQVHAAFQTGGKPEAAPKPVAGEREHTMAVLKTGLAACALLILLYVIGFGASRSAVVFQHAYRVAQSGRNQIIASDPFTVPDRGGNLRLDVSTQVDNNWIGLNLSLVGAGGSPSVDAARTIEYYSGYDSDGRWTEGSQDERIMFRSIPGGMYRLLVEVDAGVFGNAAAVRQTVPSFIPGTTIPVAALPPVNEPVVTFTIAARRHAPAPELFWFALLLILPYPLYRLFFKRRRAG